MNQSTVCILGLGYIGLPTAAVLASPQTRVIGVDVNEAVVRTINSGQVHIIEPGLDELVSAAVRQGFFIATCDPEPADVFLIAVPTPFLDDKLPDLSYIKSATASIASVLKAGDLIVLESTSPVGTTEQISIWLSALRPDLSFPHTHGTSSQIRIAHCPERVLPGKVLRELVENDRIIGGLTPLCGSSAAALYRRFVKGECLVTDARTAEMCKLAENSFRDTNIAFANELSIICAQLGINVWDLIELANRHPRVNILQPGPGVGGHCIAVDPWFIVSAAPEHARLIRTARHVNDEKPEWVISRTQDAIEEVLAGSPGRTESDVTVACLGLAFKADIDDLRESPALEITRRLASVHPGTVWAVEPNIQRLPKNLEGTVSLRSLDEAIQQADVFVLLVDHREFRQHKPNFSPNQALVDTRGVWSKGP